MKNLALLIIITLVSCFGKQSTTGQSISKENSSQDSIDYVNNAYEMKIYLKDKTIYDFKLYSINNDSIVLKGKPELILVDGEIPEGSLRQDHNNPNDYRGYECDATYQYISKKIKIAFALEKETYKRLDLVIYDSEVKQFIDGDYTLIRKGIK